MFLRVRFAYFFCVNQDFLSLFLLKIDFRDHRGNLATKERYDAMLKKILYTGLVIILLFIGLSRFLRIGEGGLESYASYVLYPFLLLQKNLSMRLSHWWFHQKTPQELAKYLLHYQNLSEQLQQEVIELKSLAQYKENTQDMRDFLQRYKTDYGHFTQILLKHFDKNHFFLVDAGARKGITKDMIAVYKDCLIGRVIEVYPYYSKVVLITDPSCKVAALCISNNVKGIHEGIGSLEMTRLSFVNHLEKLKIDDLVVSSGEGLIFPRGFGLGRIMRWETDGYNCVVDLKPLLDFKTLDYCYIIQKGAELKEAPQNDSTLQTAH